MSEAHKLPSGRWRNQLYVGRDPKTGKRIYESFDGDTKKEADRKAAVRARELELGVKKSRVPALMTVGDAVDSYIATNESVLAPKTIREYKGYRARYMQGLMSVRIRDLTNVSAQAEINREARRLSPKSVRNAWGLVLTAIRAAVPDYRIDVNLPAKRKTEMNIPTEEQLAGLLEDLAGTRLEIPVLIAAACGLRRGEIAALRFPEDVDAKRNVLRVRRVMTQNDAGEWLIEDRTKTYESTRDVECPPWLIEKILALPPDYKPVHPAYLTSGFSRAAHRRGLDIHFHNLRHYYASLLIAVGAPDQYIMRRMGHTTTNMLHTVYGHIMADRDRQITESLNARLETMQHDMQHAPDPVPENP